MFKKHNDQALKDVLKQLANQRQYRTHLLQLKVNSAWASTMGETINNYTEKLNLRGSRLYVSINSAPLRQELMMAKDKIKTMLNEKLEEEILKEVIIR